MANNFKNKIETIEFSKYVQPIIDPLISKEWVLNGEFNSFYKYIKDCYEGSTTNAAIINAYSNYIYGEGLRDTKGQNLLKYISKNDTRLIVQDYKTYGAYALQVIWNLAKTHPLQLKYIPVFKLGLNVDKETNETNGYWYCFDWTKQSKYPPQFFHKYCGQYKEHPVEIIMIQRPSSNPFFANPDYLPALQYCQTEMELANWTINHILQGFQGSTLINCNSGVPPTEELEDQYRKDLKKQLTGTNNAGRIIISFNETAAQAMTVENIPLPELNDQYESYYEKAQQRIIAAHAAPAIIFTGSRENSGFGSNAEEVETLTKSLYRTTINPMREVIIDGLNEVFIQIDPTIDLYFKDFDSFDEDTKVKITETEKTTE